MYFFKSFCTGFEVTQYLAKHSDVWISLLYNLTFSNECEVIYLMREIKIGYKTILTEIYYQRSGPGVKGNRNQ